LQRRGILHKTVAAEAGVSKFLVSHVLAGRAKSQNVVNTMKRLTAAPPEPAP
jgi:DNA-binding LacI/PurR family transcriptional regulator